MEYAGYSLPKVMRAELAFPEPDARRVIWRLLERCESAPLSSPPSELLLFLSRSLGYGFTLLFSSNENPLGMPTLSNPFLLYKVERLNPRLSLFYSDLNQFQVY
jgi:hypothetical protein